jgi:hypothetical protein
MNKRSNWPFLGRFERFCFREISISRLQSMSEQFIKLTMVMRSDLGEVGENCFFAIFGGSKRFFPSNFVDFGVLNHQNLMKKPFQIQFSNKLILAKLINFN